MVLNSNLFYSYHIITFLLKKFGLIIKYGKIKVFHFSRLYSTFNPLPLDLILLGGPILWSKNTWCYLRFIFNNILTFILIKQYQQSSVWRCLEIHWETSSQLKRGFYIEVVSYWLLYTAFNCGTITKHHFYTLLKYSETCREE